MDSNDLCEIYAIRPSAVVAECFPAPPAAAFLGQPSQPPANPVLAARLFHNHVPVKGFFTASFPALNGVPATTQALQRALRPLEMEGMLPCPPPVIPIAQRSGRAPVGSTTLLSWQR